MVNVNVSACIEQTKVHLVVPHCCYLDSALRGAQEIPQKPSCGVNVTGSRRVWNESSKKCGVPPVLEVLL